MAPKSIKNGANLAQGVGKGYPKINRNINNRRNANANTKMRTKQIFFYVCSGLRTNKDVQNRRRGRKLCPRRKARGQGRTILPHFVDFYGYRGSHPAVYYLNAWEFVMLRAVLPLPRPKALSESDPVPLTNWKTHPKTKEKTAEYKPNPAAASDHNDAEASVLFYSTIPGKMQLRDR